MKISAEKLNGAWTVTIDGNTRENLTRDEAFSVIDLAMSNAKNHWRRTVKIVLTEKQIVQIVSEHVGRHREAFGLPKNYATAWTHVDTKRFTDGTDTTSEVCITIHTKETT